jgi:protein TonB
MNFAQERNPARQMAGFGLVVLMHGILGYVILSGLATRTMDAIKGPLEAKMIEQVKPPPPDAPPPPPPELAPPPPPFIPPPEINIQQTVTQTNAIQAVTAVVPVVAAPVPVAPKPAVADTAVSARSIDNSVPEYPKRMKDTGREGSADVECTVDTDGSTSNCALIEVHGGDSFGDSAMSWLKNHKYHPATHNGTPVKEEHHRFHIGFSLNG